MKKSLYVLAAALIAAAAAGCSSGQEAAETTAAAAQTQAAEETQEEAAEETQAASGELETIIVGASPAPHAEILEAAREVLAQKGYDLQVMEYLDYIQPNLALESGDLDANYVSFLATMAHVPVIYVHGNHDEAYDRKPPGGAQKGGAHPGRTRIV